MATIMRLPALRAHASTRGALLTPVNTSMRQSFARHSSSLPSVTQGSFWRSMIPKAWRPAEKRPDVYFGPPKTLKKTKPKKDWNPATFYIVIFLFIGSMSIQMISLRRDYSTYMRRAETKIGVLQEVLEKLQRGEEVDVKKALGTGDAEQEKEWEEGMHHVTDLPLSSSLLTRPPALREIVQDQTIRSPKRPDRPKHSSSTTVAQRDEPQPTQAPSTDKPKAATAKYSGFF